MDNNYFKSVIDADEAPVVICDLSHTVVYMNPTAVKRYEKTRRRGADRQVADGLPQCRL